MATLLRSAITSFPVPANWHVEDLGNDSFALIRLDTDDYTSPRKYKQHAGIMILHHRPMKDEALNRILTLESDQLKKRGVDPVPQHNFSVGDEMIDCIGGEPMPLPPDIPDVFDIQPVTWSCKSSGGLALEIMGSEPDLNQVWEIVTHIRKKT